MDGLCQWRQALQSFGWERQECAWHESTKQNLQVSSTLQSCYVATDFKNRRSAAARGLDGSDHDGDRKRTTCFRHGRICNLIRNSCENVASNKIAADICSGMWKVSGFSCIHEQFNYNWIPLQMASDPRIFMQTKSFTYLDCPSNDAFSY